MPFDISGLLWLGLVALAFVGYLRWLSHGPSVRTRDLVRQAMEAKGLSFVSVRLEPKIRIGRGSRALLIANGKDAYGNARKIYFEVDFWADNLTRNPTVKEIGTYLSPARFLAGDDT